MQIPLILMQDQGQNLSVSDNVSNVSYDGGDTDSNSKDFNFLSILLEAANDKDLFLLQQLIDKTGRDLTGQKTDAQSELVTEENKQVKEDLLSKIMHYLRSEDDGSFNISKLMSKDDCALIEKKAIKQGLITKQDMVPQFKDLCAEKAVKLDVDSQLAVQNNKDGAFLEEKGIKTGLFKMSDHISKTGGDALDNGETDIKSSKVQNMIKELATGAFNKKKGAHLSDQSQRADFTNDKNNHHKTFMGGQEAIKIENEVSDEHVERNRDIMSRSVNQDIKFAGTKIKGLQTAGLEERPVDVKSESKYDNVLLLHTRSNDKISSEVISVKGGESFQKPVQNDVISQIVQKAVLNIKNGQTSIKISLKPEHLGRLELKILTDNHQVVIKVLTEIPSVKDIIQSNVHQLRAELGNHGLEIDKLDVFVSGDSENKDNRRHHTGHLKMDEEHDDNDTVENESSEEEDYMHTTVEGGDGTNLIGVFA